MTVAGGTAFSGPPLQDKTLVSWVAPGNLTQRGGSVLTVDDGQGHFDGIVFGEIEQAKWMAGSEVYQRTHQQQSDWPAETAGPGSWVQMAVVYRGQEITIYRNGAEYARHNITKPQFFGADSVVLIGPRHLDNRSAFGGAVADARIYDRAMTAEEIAALKPGVEGPVKPWAWWSFEHPDVKERTGRFPHTRLVGGAKVEKGKLVLDGNNAALIAGQSATVENVLSAQPAPDTAVPPPELVLNYHLMHPGGTSSPGDPNAAFYMDGVYHFHYILHHPWQGTGSYSFIHVTSTDMLHWTWQQTKLQPSFTGHGMFSGTGFMTKEGRPAVIYHGAGSGRNWIAIAKDRQLSAWEEPYPVDVRNADGTEAKLHYWDPDIFLIGDSYYAISGGGNPPLFKSKDLKIWTLVGDFLRHHPADVTIGEDVSCANFFPLGEKWMLLTISHPLGCRYYIGGWDAEAEQFVPEQHGRMNWARQDQPVWGLWRRSDFFAPESVLTPDGRRVMWAWIAGNGLTGRTIQSLPRELSLPDDGVLRIRPLRELETLRQQPLTLTEVLLAHPVEGHQGPVPPVAAPQLQRLAELPGDAVEIRITIPRGDADRKLFGFMLFSDGKGGGLPILLRPETGTLRVGTTEAPFSLAELPDGQDVELRIFVDKYLVEVFANDRQAVVATHLEHADQRGFDAFTVGTPTRLNQVDIWKLKPTNQGFLEAQESRNWQPSVSAKPASPPAAEATSGQAE